MRVTFGSAVDCDDDQLEDLSSIHEWAPEEDANSFGATTTESPPFEVEVAEPLVFDLFKMYEALDRPLPPECQAMSGDRRLVMIHHRMTPFHAAAQSPQRIWGLGYQATSSTESVTTMQVFPEAAFKQAAKVSQTLQIGIGVDGRFSVVDLLGIPTTPIPGVTIGQLEAKASIDTEFAVILGFVVSWLTVQSGPLGSGGARWNLYCHGERLDGCQALFQTALIESSTSELSFDVATWIRRKRSFRARGSSEWKGEPMSFTVPIL